MGPARSSSPASEPANSRTGVPRSEQPVLRVLNADATPEEIAALVAVLSALDTGAAPPPEPTSEWSSHHRKVRRTLPHGPGGWRASALPH